MRFQNLMQPLDMKKVTESLSDPVEFFGAYIYDDEEPSFFGNSMGRGICVLVVPSNLEKHVVDSAFMADFIAIIICGQWPADNVVREALECELPIYVSKTTSMDATRIFKSFEALIS